MIVESFFKVVSIDEVKAHAAGIEPVSTETVALDAAAGRILAQDIVCDRDLPGFVRSTMDGYALKASSTFGASENSPAYITVCGDIAMGQRPEVTVRAGEAVRIPTGGMLPDGADAVVMIEHTETIDATSIEIYKSVAPGQHVIDRDEDFAAGRTVLSPGNALRPQEIGLLAAFGCARVRVFRKPVVTVISTGDEIVPVDRTPAMGEVRDVNSHTLAAQVAAAGGQAVQMGIIRDDDEALADACRKAVESSDMVMISGGSSVGTRDFTLSVFESLPESRILAHGISIRPGKPTILASSGNTLLWGLPGHVVSAMVVFDMVVAPFLARLCGKTEQTSLPATITARLSRNLASVQGRTDYVRVRVVNRDGQWIAEPLLGKSGLLNTMVSADGLVVIDIHSEGLDKDTEVQVIPMCRVPEPA